MLKTVEGIYQNGQIELAELPQDVSDRTQVLVTFLAPGKIDSTKLRQKIEQQLAQLPPDQLSWVSDFLDSLQSKSTTSQRSLRRLAPIKRGTKAGDVLKFAGTWQGNDLEECLRFVNETRSKAEF